MRAPQGLCGDPWSTSPRHGALATALVSPDLISVPLCLFSLRLPPLQSESSSSSNISTMLVTHDYTAVKEDEINVYQGEVVQVLASNQQNMFLVFRAATDQCPAAEGWIPGFVLGHTSTVVVENPDGTLK